MVRHRTGVALAPSLLGCWHPDRRCLVRQEVVGEPRVLAIQWRVENRDCEVLKKFGVPQ